MNELSERATLSLKTSLECSWNVKVRKSGRDVYFEDGWQKFLRDNSLGDCEFLLFNYDGKMHFTIQIFDKSGCERDDFPDTEQQNSTLLRVLKGLAVDQQNTLSLVLSHSTLAKRIQVM